MESSLLSSKISFSPQSILKEYYARYLLDVRGLSQSSVNHYFDALNNISRRLKAKGLVENDIYEIADLDRLLFVREVLYSDADFVEMNERGKRMYSAGLNNYCKFATGAGFVEARSKVEVLDIPVAPEASVMVERSVWRRSGILRAQALEIAGYTCEIDSSHTSFISAQTKKPYMEGHHAMPMNMQDHFSVSLDVYANIVCLCPICHGKIHYGIMSERKDMIKEIYEKRKLRLVKSGIEMSKDEFVSAVLRA